MFLTNNNSNIMRRRILKRNENKTVNKAGGGRE
jgi:hypothetical protein